MWLRYVQTKEEQKKILHGCHVDSTAGHMGREKTLYRIKERFMWKGMYRDVQELVSVHSLYVAAILFRGPGGPKSL